MPNRRKTSKRRRSSKKPCGMLWNGGGGAAEFGVAAYGQAGNQVARGDGTNMIAVNANACTRGGGSRAKRGAKGGAFLDTVALPAAFIAANNMYKPRRAKTFRRSRKSSRRR